MIERKKLWLSITAAVWTGAGTFSIAHAQDDSPAASHSMHSAQPASMATGEGEGEGGGESSNLLDDDIAFLTRLGLIRGHLRVGNALYQAGHVDMSATHMKHPRDELYAGLVPAIEFRGATTFDQPLSGLANAVESNAGADRVQAAWQAVDDAIQAVETRVDAPLSAQLLAIVAVLRTAGEEYALGVVDGQIENVHEFQDAWGFTQVAGQRLASLNPSSDAEQVAVQRASDLVDDLQSLWPSLAPEESVQGRSSALYGAAARIELLAYGLER